MLDFNTTGDGGFLATILLGVLFVSYEILVSYYYLYNAFMIVPLVYYSLLVLNFLGVDKIASYFHRAVWILSLPLSSIIVFSCYYLGSCLPVCWGYFCHVQLQSCSLLKKCSQRFCASNLWCRTLLLLWDLPTPILYLLKETPPSKIGRPRI